MVRHMSRGEWWEVTQEESRLDHRGWLTRTFQVLGFSCV